MADALARTGADAAADIRSLFSGLPTAQAGILAYARGCGALIFPRIEPAVITLVETSTQPRRCLLARHRAWQAGGYSLLAGFLELGESLEDAVSREIFEEVGVRLRDVRYAGSQPWSSRRA